MFLLYRVKRTTMFEYESEQSENFVPELQKIFPDLITVPYICYLKSGSIEKYDGKLDISEIDKWMNETRSLL